MAGIGTCDNCLRLSEPGGFCLVCASGFTNKDPKTARVIRAMGSVAGRDEATRREGETLEAHQARCLIDDVDLARMGLAAWATLSDCWPAAAQDSYLDGWHDGHSRIVIDTLGRKSRKAK